MFNASIKFKEFSVEELQILTGVMKKGLDLNNPIKLFNFLMWCMDPKRAWQKKLTSGPTFLRSGRMYLHPLGLLCAKKDMMQSSP